MICGRLSKNLIKIKSFHYLAGKFKIIIMDPDIRKKARKRVRAIKGFYIHAFTYVLMGVFFFLMNMTTDPWDMWFFYPMIPWGVGLSFHYLAIFGIPGTRILTKEWEEREYERQLEKLEGSTYTDDYRYTRNEDRYLEYRELSEEETLELRKMQRDPNRYLNEDLV